MRKIHFSSLVYWGSDTLYPKLSISIYFVLQLPLHFTLYTVNLDGDILFLFNAMTNFLYIPSCFHLCARLLFVSLAGFTSQDIIMVWLTIDGQKAAMV